MLSILGNTANMDYTLALLVSLVQVFSVCKTAPLSEQALRFRVNIKKQAHQLVVKIDRDFQFPTDLTIIPEDDNMESFYSIMMVLQGYESLLSDSIDRVPQLKQEISSLSHTIDHWRQGHCDGEQPAKAKLPHRLEELQRHKDYPITVTQEALKGVKECLNHLLKNLTCLQVC